MSHQNDLTNLLIVGVLFSLSSLLFSCNNSGTNAKADSSQTAQKDTVPMVALEDKQFAIRSLTSSPEQILEKIPYDSVLASRRVIRSAAPVLNAGGSPVQGFFLNSKDYKSLAKLKAASLYFEFGIHNTGDSIGIRNHTIKPQYTLMVIPLDVNQKTIPDADKNPTAYDYVCPCSNGVGCCPTGL